MGKQVMLFSFLKHNKRWGGVKLYSVKVCFCCLFVLWVVGILKPPWENLASISSTLEMNTPFSYI